MNLETLLSLALSIISLGAVLWRAGSEAERIKASIKDVRDEILYRYDVELERLKAKLFELEYRANANTELINHKSQRLEQEISNIKGFLQKQSDFKVRRANRLRGDDDDGEPVTGPL